jgi:hypothetical protein
VACVKDLYIFTARNGFYLPKEKSSAVNELMLINVLKGTYWCPKDKDIRVKNCVTAPLKETLIQALMLICEKNKHNIAWIDETHMPDKKWLVDVIATLDPENEIFKKDYVAPPIRKRLRDIETITLPNELFEGMPLSTSKVKARRLKIMSEAFAAEKAARNREMEKRLYDDMLEQECKREKYQMNMVAKAFQPMKKNQEEEKKGGAGASNATPSTA